MKKFERVNWKFFDYIWKLIKSFIKIRKRQIWIQFELNKKWLLQYHRFKYSGRRLTYSHCFTVNVIFRFMWLNWPDLPSRKWVSMTILCESDICVTVSFGSGSGGRISWDRNSTFSGDRIINHEVKIPNNWFDLLIAAVFMRSKLPNNAF